MTLAPASQSLQPSVSAERVTCWNVPLFNNVSVTERFLQLHHSWLLPSLKQRELILLLNVLTTDEQILCKIFLQAAPTTEFPQQQLKWLLQHLLFSISVTHPIFHFVWLNHNRILNPRSSVIQSCLNVGRESETYTGIHIKIHTSSSCNGLILSFFYWKYIQKYHW